jgi:hypothetical protein
MKAVLDDVRQSSVVMVSESGLINSELFLNWPQHCQDNVRAKFGSSVYFGGMVARKMQIIKNREF